MLKYSIYKNYEILKLYLILLCVRYCLLDIMPPKKASTRGRPVKRLSENLNKNFVHPAMTQTHETPTTRPVRLSLAIKKNSKLNKALIMVQPSSGGLNKRGNPSQPSSGGMSKRVDPSQPSSGGLNNDSFQKQASRLDACVPIVNGFTQVLYKFKE